MFAIILIQLIYDILDNFYDLLYYFVNIGRYFKYNNLHVVNIQHHYYMYIK